jgi:hypothetical protein
MVRVNGKNAVIIAYIIYTHQYIFFSIFCNIFGSNTKRCRYPNTDYPRCRICDKGCLLMSTLHLFAIHPEHIDQAIKMEFDTPRFYFPIQIYQCAENGYMKINYQSSTLDIMGRYCGPVRAE